MDLIPDVIPYQKWPIELEDNQEGYSDEDAWPQVIIMEDETNLLNTGDFNRDFW